MPATTGLFAVGALGAAALPLGNGFVSEWLLLQALIHSLPATAVATAVTMPLAVGVVALTAGLAVATFVKALGVGFFAQPRTPAAERATECGPAMLAGMGLAAAACVGLALAPTLLAPALARAVNVAVPGTEAATTGRLSLELSGITGSMSPLLIAAALAVAAAGTLATVRVFAARRARRAARLWDCGGGGLTARMEYTATSFAEPLQRVFDDVLRPEQDIDVTHVQESRYLVDTISYRRRVPDRIETPPVHAAARSRARVGRGRTAARERQRAPLPRLRLLRRDHASHRPGGDTVNAGVAGAVLQIAVVAGGAPILAGLMRQVRARMEGRAGAGIAQPWRDLRKLLRKEPITPRGSGAAFRAAPTVLMATALRARRGGPVRHDGVPAGRRRRPHRGGGAARVGHRCPRAGRPGHRHRVRWDGRQPGDDHRSPWSSPRSCSPCSRCRCGSARPTSRAIVDRHPGRSAARGVPGQPARRRGARGRDDRRDRSAAGGQPVHPP